MSRKNQNLDRGADLCGCILQAVRLNQLRKDREYPEVLGSNHAGMWRCPLERAAPVLPGHGGAARNQRNVDLSAAVHRS